MIHNDDFHDDDLPVSKSQRKREMHALQDLGKRLTVLDNPTLEKLQLPDKLAKAIEEYKRLPKKHEARRRQLQFIGKLMRDVDTTRVEQVLEHSKQNVELERRRFHKLEETRDALVAGDQDLLQQLIEEYPGFEIQHLRQLLRQAQKESQLGKPPSASRKLFRYLREIMLAE